MEGGIGRWIGDQDSTVAWDDLFVGIERENGPGEDSRHVARARREAGRGVEGHGREKQGDGQGEGGQGGRGGGGGSAGDGDDGGDCRAV